MKDVTITKGEATSARIIEAAYQLFLEQGYHGTSMRQIVDRAGITMGGIYNHFASKEAIWEAVFMTKHPYHQIMPVLQEAQGETIAEFVRDAARRLVGELGQRDDLLNLMFIELVEFDAKHVPALINAILPDTIRVGETLAHKRGKLHPIPPPVLARSFAGLFFSYYITELLMPGEFRPMMGNRAFEDIVDIYLYGILDEPPEAAHG